MGPETVGTLVVTGIIVLALAGYVFLIGLGLQRLSFTLGTIIVGLRAIREQTRPATPVLSGILADVTGIENDLQGVVGAVGEALGAAAAAPAPAPPTAVENGKPRRGRAQARLPEPASLS